jgi:hypothetical protein
MWLHRATVGQKLIRAFSSVFYFPLVAKTLFIASLPLVGDVICFLLTIPAIAAAADSGLAGADAFVLAARLRAITDTRIKDFKKFISIRVVAEKLRQMKQGVQRIRNSTFPATR